MSNYAFLPLAGAVLWNTNPELLEEEFSLLRKLPIYRVGVFYARMPLLSYIKCSISSKPWKILLRRFYPRTVLEASRI